MLYIITIQVILFYKPLWGSSGVIESCISYLRLPHRSDGLHYLFMRLTAHPLLGLVGEAAPTPINLLALWHGWLLPWFFFVTRYVVKKWIFARTGFSEMYGLETLRFYAIFTHSLSCGFSLWSCGVSFVIFSLSRVFGGGSEVAWWTVCPELLEGLRSFLRVSTVIGSYPKYLENLIVLPILSLSFDMVVNFH